MHAASAAARSQTHSAAAERVRKAKFLGRRERRDIFAVTRVDDGGQLS